MPIDLHKLIERIKTSQVLTDKERKEWLKRMETMKEEDLAELGKILDYAETIDMENAAAEIDDNMSKAEEICDKAEKTIETMVRKSSPA